VVPDVQLDPRYIMLNPETRSELAVPMIHKDRVIGVMDLESPQLNYFTPDHVQVLSILAANLAVSIENAHLYERVRRDETRMERDLNAARRRRGRECEEQRDGDAHGPRLPSALGEHVAYDDHALDLARALVDPQQLGVAHNQQGLVHALRHRVWLREYPHGVSSHGNTANSPRLRRR